MNAISAHTPIDVPDSVAGDPPVEDVVPVSVHVPVLLPEVLAALFPKNTQHYLDGTFGAGGYTRAILKAANCQVTALDRDPNVAPYVAVMKAEFGDRFHFVPANFADLEGALGRTHVEGIVLDIGVSSMQIDEGRRGFSFQKTGPLDMRMAGTGVSAKDAITHLTHDELIRVFKVYGEEVRARRCADFIVRAREQEVIETTDALAKIIARALGRGGKRHPATKVFQALRIYVNDELGALSQGLMAAERVLPAGGRLVVVTFHSLEDRIVKDFFNVRGKVASKGSRYAPPTDDPQAALSFDISGKQGRGASDAEIKANPRARSARLRYGVRTSAPALEGQASLYPGIPSLKDLARRVP